MESVYLLDDDEHYRELVQLSLEDGCGVPRVFGFSAPADLLLHVAAGGASEPDLILLDLHLPGASGRDVLRDLRRQGVKAPVAFLSGAGDHAERDGCLADGAVAFLRKPVDHAELVRALQGLMSLDSVKQKRAP